MTCASCLNHLVDIAADHRQTHVKALARLVVITTMLVLIGLTLLRGIQKVILPLAVGHVT